MENILGPLLGVCVCAERIPVTKSYKTIDGTCSTALDIFERIAENHLSAHSKDVNIHSHLHL